MAEEKTDKKHSARKESIGKMSVEREASDEMSSTEFLESNIIGFEELKYFGNGTPKNVSPSLVTDVSEPANYLNDSNIFPGDTVTPSGLRVPYETVQLVNSANVKCFEKEQPEKQLYFKQRSCYTSSENQNISEQTTTKSTENIDRTKSVVPSERVTENHTCSDSSSDHDASLFQYASEPTKSNALTETSANAFKGTFASDAEKVKGKMKKLEEKTCTNPDVKLQSFQTRFSRFSFPKIPQCSTKTDETSSSAIEREKLQRSEILKIMLENIFAQISPRPSFSKAINASQPISVTANEKKDQNEKKEKISETSLESEGADCMPCIKLNEKEECSSETMVKSKVAKRKFEWEQETKLKTDVNSRFKQVTTKRPRSEIDPIYHVESAKELPLRKSCRSCVKKLRDSSMSQKKSKSTGTAATEVKKNPGHSRLRNKAGQQKKTESPEVLGVSSVLKRIPSQSPKVLHKARLRLRDSSMSQEKSKSTETAAAEVKENPGHSRLRNKVGKQRKTESPGVLDVSSVLKRTPSQSSEVLHKASMSRLKRKHSDPLIQSLSSDQQMYKSRETCSETFHLYKSTKTYSKMQGYRAIPSYSLGISNHRPKAGDKLEVEKNKELWNDGNSYTNRFYICLIQRAVESVKAEEKASKDTEVGKLDTEKTCVEQVESSPEINTEKKEVTCSKL